jgi:hypothetical protein
MVIVVITLLVGIMLIVKLNLFGMDLNSDIECASQVQINSAISSTTKEIKSPDIICPTKFITVEETDENAVKKKLADQMLKCWNTWGKGEKMLFGEKEGVYCHVCSMIEVQGVDKVSGFGDYLDNTVAKDGWTYSALLQGRKKGTYFKDDAFKSQASQDIDTTRPMATVFFYAKGKKWYEELRNKVVGQPAAGAVGGAVAAGVIASSTGVGLPVGVLMVGTGSAVGLTASVWGRADSSYMTLVVLRPLTKEDIATLKCDYAPAKN